LDDGGTPAVIIYQFAGTVDGQGNFVRIGVSAQGFLIGGGKFESGQLTANSVNLDKGHVHEYWITDFTHIDPN
jgi:hypothetical protein